MGNVCYEERPELELNKQYSVLDHSKLQANKKDVPSSSYAVMQGKPLFLPQIVEMKYKAITQIEPIRDPPEIQKGRQLPTFFIKERNLYYEGEWVAGKPQGKGKVYLKNGTLFQGSFKNGQADCRDGLLIYPDGSYYRGQISDSKLNGKGEFIYSLNGLRYKGQWKDDKPHGYGEQYFRDGSTYQGPFKNGLKDGDKGHFSWKDRKQYIGSFKQGYMDGKGTLRKGNGYFDGIFKRNLKVSGKLVTQFGEYQGPFVDGEMHGIGKFKWKDGKVYEGEFAHGQLHGNGVITYHNGQKAKGVWKEGENIAIENISN